ncbi:HAD family phosphatase [Puteibacter caeruleilacunae]|nr:HAD family phosphatase [Puteibacter caeruleilacunae]
MDIKNIIFDFGGVLIDWNPEYLYRHVFSEKSEMDFFLKHICSSEWNLQQDAGRPFGQATLELQLKFPRYHNEIELFYLKWDQMLGGEITKNVKLIDELKTKYSLYGLTNWSAETFPIVFQRYQFFKKLDGIVVSGEEKMIKPDPSIYCTLLDRYQLIARECLFIDDNKENISAANRLGIHTIHLQQGVDLKKELQILKLLPKESRPTMTLV